MLALASVVLALVYLLLKRPVEEAGAAAPAAATAGDHARPSTAPGGPAHDFKGYILAQQPIVVSPKVSGTIVKLHVGEGCRVKKGDVLAELDDLDFKADCRRAQWAVEKAERQLAEAQTSQPKEIGQAEAEMERSKLELGELQAEFERTRDLYYKQAASKTEYESSESKFHESEQHIRSLVYALEAMRSSLTQKIATARSQLEEAQADLAKIRWRLDCCTVRADERHDSQEKRRGGQSGQQQRQPVRTGQPLGVGSRGGHSGVRHPHDQAGRALPGPHGGLSRPRL